ncbi:MAG: hypothetical protein Q7U53_01615 [Anaerolineaceae bacterium]|nr:hypothetical protein [Anaerolineaceae bacterium]
MKFKKNLEKELTEIAKEFRDLFHEINESIGIDEVGLDFIRDFFKDYNSSYSLSLAYPESLWKLTAENMGIDSEGKDRLQLVKELFSNIPDDPQSNTSSDSNGSSET